MGESERCRRPAPAPFEGPGRLGAEASWNRRNARKVRRVSHAEWAQRSFHENKCRGNRKATGLDMQRMSSKVQETPNYLDVFFLPVIREFDLAMSLRQCCQPCVAPRGPAQPGRRLPTSAATPKFQAPPGVSLHARLLRVYWSLPTIYVYMYIYKVCALEAQSPLPAPKAEGQEILAHILLSTGLVACLQASALHRADEPLQV